MRHVMPCVLVLSLVACSVGGGGTPEEQPESRIDYEPFSTFENDVLTIDATQGDGTRIRLNTLRDAESTAPYPPPYLVFGSRVDALEDGGQQHFDGLRGSEMER